MKQNLTLKQPKKIGVTCQYRSVQVQGIYSIYMVYFADATRPCKHGQLGYIDGLVNAKQIHESIFHLMDWHSHLSREPDTLSGSAETLAGSKALEMGLICVKE